MNSNDLQPPKNQVEKPLSEKDFIQNGWNLTSLPFWVWLFLMASITAIIWGTINWYHGVIQQEKKHEPFFEVTNREFSVFLWQFPSFMRVNVSKKTGYLPGFLTTEENVNLDQGEEFVSAPPDLLYLYHTWNRLLAPDYISRPIPSKEFSEFLEQLPEWKPKNWKNAPVGYIQLIETKKYTTLENLQTLSQENLPNIVRQVFQGWKNYFKEGEKINELQPTFGQVKVFLEKHPTYARNYWRNISEVNGQPVAGLNYLHSFINPTFNSESIIPNEQLAPFLKVALFNAQEAEQDR